MVSVWCRFADSQRRIVLLLFNMIGLKRLFLKRRMDACKWGIIYFSVSSSRSSIGVFGGLLRSSLISCFSLGYYPTFKVTAQGVGFAYAVSSLSSF